MVLFSSLADNPPASPIPLTDYNGKRPTRKDLWIERMLTRRRLIWIVLLVLVVLLALPAPIAERYTSPTQDGQYLVSPLRSYGFIMILARVGGTATLGSSGKALIKAKSLFTSDRVRPTKVELLYLPDSKPHSYISRSGEMLSIVAPPRLVWEVWGAGAQPDVIGFLDYVSGEQIGTSGSGSL
jgi:hypothetical protein